MTDFVKRFRLAAVDDRSVYWLMAASALGAYVFIRPFLNLLFIFIDLLLPGPSFKKIGIDKGAYAVVTGTTSGIGEEFARQLAQKGWNIILISRNTKKLEEQADLIKRESGVKVELHSIDFVSATPKEWAALEAFLGKFTIGMLVNNAGTGPYITSDFIDTEVEENDATVLANCQALQKISRIVAPVMAKQRFGMIVNNSSFTGICPAPTVGMYSATKAFVHSLSSSMGYELAKHNVQVYCLNTAYVTSKLSTIETSAFGVPDPRSYVKAVIYRLGRKGAGLILDPHVVDLHPAQAFITWSVVSFLPKKHLMTAAFMQFEGIRRKAVSEGRRQERKKTV